MIRRIVVPPLGLLAALLACRAGDAAPAALDPGTETCRSCRMPVSDPSLAAQLSAPAEEPLFFDEAGCLRDFLRAAPTLPRGTTAFVADHRTGDWVRASLAVFSRCPSVATPMGSHLLAHADAASRDADPAARACASVSVEELFGPAGPPDGGR